MITARLQEAPIDLSALRREIPRLDDCGGYACFEGIVRNRNDGKLVESLSYESYPQLAELELSRILTEASKRFGLGYAQAVHRVGKLEIGETAVLVQVMSEHRAEAFAGCRYIIDELKMRVPIWKKERYLDGTSEWTRCHSGAGYRPAGPERPLPEAKQRETS